MSTSPNRIYAGNLSWGTDDASLKAHFSSAGVVLEAIVMRESETARSRGFGFVTFQDTDSAYKAIQKLNESVLDGRQIKVNTAKEQVRANTASSVAMGTLGRSLDGHAFVHRPSLTDIYGQPYPPAGPYTYGPWNPYPTFNAPLPYIPLPPNNAQENNNNNNMAYPNNLQMLSRPQPNYTDWGMRGGYPTPTPASTNTGFSGSPDSSPAVNGGAPMFGADVGGTFHQAARYQPVSSVSH
jgi:RNA recognition motif-containing protein